jgi:7-cyano-7-deazaguanine reductase
MGTIPDSPLGKPTRYHDTYDPTLLYPVERAPQREALGIADALPFVGADRWTAWELSWLDLGGRPQVAIATFDVPCESPRIVESKSVKLYLTALNGSRFADEEALASVITRDLAAATGAPVVVQIVPPARWSGFARAELAGESIDAAELASHAANPDPTFLRASGAPVEQALVCRVFRSVCPVTGQPDFAQVQVRCLGPRVDRGGLLAYLVGYRHYPGFHETCVERIFVDIQRACAPLKLSVLARFTRRGGIDINPWRSDIHGFVPDHRPTAHQ